MDRSGVPIVQGGLVGKVVAGRYVVTSQIGRGGMGAIYEVRHTRLGRRFALKTLTAELNGASEALARFRREADIVARLRHPNIVDIIDWDTLDDGSPCMVMEYLEGQDLASYLHQTGPLPWDTLARISDQIMSALTAAHRAGVTHRDIKLQNVFLATDDVGEARVKLLDFGIGKVHEAKSLITGEFQLLGTPAHMSPEQVAGAVDKIGPPTDVWAMGTILFEMATARPAFTGPTVPAILYQVCHGDLPMTSHHRPDTPPLFDTVVARALERDLCLRTATIEALRNDVRTALTPIAPRAFVEPLRAGIHGLQTAPSVGSLSTISRASGQRARAGQRFAARARLPVIAGLFFAFTVVLAMSLTGRRDPQEPLQVPAGVPSSRPTRTTPVLHDAGLVDEPELRVEQVLPGNPEPTPAPSKPDVGESPERATPAKSTSSSNRRSRTRIHVPGKENAHPAAVDGDIVDEKKPNGPRIPTPEEIYGRRTKEGL